LQPTSGASKIFLGRYRKSSILKISSSKPKEKKKKTNNNGNNNKTVNNKNNNKRNDNDNDDDRDNNTGNREHSEQCQVSLHSRDHNTSRPLPYPILFDYKENETLQKRIRWKQLICLPSPGLWNAITASLKYTKRTLQR